MAVSRTASFSRAAEQLYKTQPAISQAIRGLEEELGQQLILREGRTAGLTEAGRILREHVRESFEWLQRARLKLEGLKALQEGSLTLSTSDTTASYILPPILKSFHDQYPGIDIHIQNHPSPQALRQVVERTADIGIVTLPVEHPKVHSEALTTRKDVAICSPRNPLAERKRVTLQKLLTHPFLMLTRESNTRRHFDSVVQQSDIQAPKMMEIGSIEVIKRLVSNDMGVSIVPLVAIQDELKMKRLHALDVFRTSQLRNLGAIYPKKGFLSLPASAFLDTLKNELKAS